ncbi:MAG: PilZ domain-containing protein [Spirochaetes bacterium]|nr:PilZ domain-containing protein [Spirochaetota bacterium]
MKYNDGEIIVAPKTIFWVEIPGIIGESEKIDLLKKDVLLVGHNGHIDSLFNLKASRTKYTAYFYNLESIFVKNKIKPEEFYAFSTNVATFIRTFAPDKSLVHSSFIYDKIADMFRDQGIPYIEKNLRDKKIAFSIVINMIRPFFTEQDRLYRSLLRLHLLPMKYKVEILNLRKPNLPAVYGYIKDLSLNGIGFVFKVRNDLSFFRLKDRIQFRLFLKESILKMNMSFITRIDPNKKEIGVNFNILDRYSIREDHANRLTSLIYNWMKGIITKYGRIDTGF